ncbi:MAG: ABC transporter permease, partial [Candidatus Eremiobacteraeota bacterium]|nr:ABC transporter permease [Candidatus Eremiobacteraeota bacterium]
GTFSGVLSWGEIAAFLVFFALGYFQYATAFAAGASLISRTEDLGSVTGPMMLPVIIGFFIAQYALLTPDSQVSVVASLIPLLSPFVMFTRIVVTAVPPWQIALSIVLNVAALGAIVLAAGKLYRVGMLLYGRAPKFGQIVAVLRSR